MSRKKPTTPAPNATTVISAMPEGGFKSLLDTSVVRFSIVAFSAVTLKSSVACALRAKVKSSLEKAPLDREAVRD